MADLIDDPRISERTKSEIRAGRQSLAEYAADSLVGHMIDKLRYKYKCHITTQIMWVGLNGEGEVRVHVSYDDQIQKKFVEKLSSFPSKNLLTFLMLLSGK